MRLIAEKNYSLTNADAFIVGWLNPNYRVSDGSHYARVFLRGYTGWFGQSKSLWFSKAEYEALCKDKEIIEVAPTHRECAIP